MPGMKHAPLRSLQFFVLVVVLAGCSPSDLARAAVSAARPVTSGKPLPAEAPTEPAEKDLALQRAWFERNFVEAYRKVGRRNPRWDAAAEAFTRESAAAFLGLAPEDSSDLRARARVVLDLGCDDPAVLYLAAWTLSGRIQDDQAREVSELFERAVAGMHETPYPRGTARFAASFLRRDYDRRSEGTGKRSALDPVELRWFRESLADGSYAPDEDAVFVSHFVGGYGHWLFSRNLAAFGAAVEAAGWIDPWVRQLFAGQRHVIEAWNSRGTEYASKVKPEEWKGMAESLAAARRALTESWRIRPDRPEAATAMINVAKTAGQDDETPRLWFDRAVAARFDHVPAYDALREALRGRWSGDPGALLAFARECAATRRFDTDVPLQAYWAVEQMEWDAFSEARREGELDDPEEARKVAEAAVLPPSPYKDPEVYELVSTVLTRYRRNPGSPRWRRFPSYQIAVDYKAERYESAREVLDQNGGVMFDAEAREDVGGRFPEARIYALASPLGGDVKRAEDLYKQGRLDEVVALLEKAHTAAPVQASPYLDHRLATVRIEADLRAGRPSTPFAKGLLAGWTPVYGTWKVEGDGALVGTSDARGHLITGDARVGPDLEVSADIEIASTSNGQFQGGIVLGRSPSIWTRDWFSFRVKKTAHEGEVVYFSQNFYRPAHPIPRPVPQKTNVVVQAWNGRLWAYVDGQPVAENYVPTWRTTRSGDAQVGFGAYIDDNTTVIRYRNVRLRRLNAPPEPPARRAASGEPARR